MIEREVFGDSPGAGGCRQEEVVTAAGRRPGLLPWIYLVGITAAELLVAWRRIRPGLALHFCLLLAVLIMAALAWTGRDAQDKNFYLSLALGPLIRIMSLTMPLQGIPLIYWYAIVGTPIYAAAFVVIRLAGYRGEDISLGAAFFSIRRIPAQIAIGLLGVPLGFLEYHILHPSPLVPRPEIGLMLLPALILLVFTGFMEELIFRGILQKAAGDHLGGRPGMIYVSILFAVLHITHLSAPDVIFVFGVALLFAFLVRRSASLLGVALAHGITNITLYLVWPHILRFFI